MQSISTTHPLQILTELETACKLHQARSTTQPSEIPLWTGLGFRIAELSLCINSKFIEEVLDSNFQSNLSSVPGAKTWLRGLTSLRGQALPVIDLQQYLFGQNSLLTTASRLLVINYSNIKIGLIVNNTYGLKRFETKDIQNPEKIKTLPLEVQKYIAQVFLSNKQTWIEFSIKNLESDPNFLNAARF